jgi:hypothetical protein
MTAGEIADAAGKDASNMKKLADEMVAEGILQATAPPALNGQPGRPARTAYTFADGEREHFEALADEESELGLLEVGLQVVMVDADKEIEALSEVLSQGDAVRGAVWAVNLDGEQSKVLIMFRGPNAVDDSLDLMGIFRDAELEAKRSTVTKLATPKELVKSEQRRKRRVDRNRVQRRAMQAGPQIDG